MIASGLMPRSPVWLRKIPSTVSGSQGSRRGFPPAVRFAFPLGARLNITLRARPCQELFSESFCRPSRGPRGAFALRASALRGDEFGIIRAPGAPRAGNPPAHRMPTTPARWSGKEGSRAAPSERERRPPVGTARLMRGHPLWRPSWSIRSIYLYIDTVSNGCRRCAWSSSRNEATRPSERPSLRECSQSSP